MSSLSVFRPVKSLDANPKYFSHVCTRGEIELMLVKWVSV